MYGVTYKCNIKAKLNKFSSFLQRNNITLIAYFQQLFSETKNPRTVSKIFFSPKHPETNYPCQSCKLQIYLTSVDEVFAKRTQIKSICEVIYTYCLYDRQDKESDQMRVFIGKKIIFISLKKVSCQGFGKLLVSYGKILFLTLSHLGQCTNILTEQLLKKMFH